MPIYQTISDLGRENIVSEIAAMKWQCEQCKTVNDLNPVDREFSKDGKVVLLVEVKCRKRSFDQYETYLIDVEKLKNLAKAADEREVKAALIIGLTDGIYWMSVTSDQPWPVERKGRDDRGDPNDMDDCYMIPMTEFRKISSGNIWEM